MLDVLQSASDDQVAILGCVTALLAAGTVMYLSYYIGPARRRELGRLQRVVSSIPQPLRHADDRAA